jgi:hypothetical protein
MLITAMERATRSRIATETSVPTIGHDRKPMLKVWGTGPIKSIGPWPTKARTELVPRMNIKAMMGAATRTERPTLRAGERVSPARMATYSNPLIPPTAIFEKILMLKSDKVGTTNASG